MQLEQAAEALAFCALVLLAVTHAEHTGALETRVHTLFTVPAFLVGLCSSSRSGSPASPALGAQDLGGAGAQQLADAAEHADVHASLWAALERGKPRGPRLPHHLLLLAPGLRGRHLRPLQPPA